MILLPALQDAVKEAEKLNHRGHDYRRAALQVLTGPGRSGKTVQAAAYATALYGAGLIEEDAVDIVNCANFTDLNDLTRIVLTAKGKVLEIDEFEKFSPDKQMGNLLAEVAVTGNCLLVFTGKTEGIQQLQQHHPKLHALLPEPIAIETIFPRNPEANRHYQEARIAERAQASRDRQAVMERRRLSEIWQQKASVDVSLPAALKPVKTVRFRPKVQP